MGIGQRSRSRVDIRRSRIGVRLGAANGPVELGLVALGRGAGREAGAVQSNVAAVLAARGAEFEHAHRKAQEHGQRPQLHDPGARNRFRGVFGALLRMSPVGVGGWVGGALGRRRRKF